MLNYQRVSVVKGLSNNYVRHSEALVFNLRNSEESTSSCIQMHV